MPHFQIRKCPLHFLNSEVHVDVHGPSGSAGHNMTRECSPIASVMTASGTFESTFRRKSIKNVNFS